ncbi:MULTISPECIES: YncE family protein [unclassified Myroides]|uniref:YncE family protein n=1 Tax=unclassified Myroides TaxID=2642485 RepID=UPI003D2F904F
MKKLLFLALSLSILSTSCSTSDDPFVEKPIAPNLDNGLIILNEGGFQLNDASIGFASFAFDKYHENIAITPEKTLGDVAHSIAFKDNKAYVVMKGSNSIEIFDRYTFKHEGSIQEGLNQPLYIAFANNLMYVTNAETHTISIYDSNNKLIQEVDMGEAVGQIIAWNTKLYVQKNISETKSEIAVLSSNFVVTKKIAIESELKGIAVLGDFVYAISSTTDKSYFYKIDAHTDSKVTEFFSTRNSNAKNLRLDNNDLYYTSANHVYNWRTSDTNVQVTPVVSIPEEKFNDASSFYGFNVINATIYIGDAGDMNEESTVDVYQKGKKVNSFKAGILTNNFYANFKK